MNISSFMSVLTDLLEVIDLEVRVCWTEASRLHVTAVIPSCRHEVWPFPEATLHLCLSSSWRTDWSVDRKVDGSSSFIHFLIIYHLDLLSWASAHSQGILLHFSTACTLFCLSRKFGHARSSLAQSLCTLRQAAKWHPGGNQKHALASLSLVLEIIWDYVQFLDLRRLQANTQACMKARRGIKEWVLCLGKF